MKDVNYDYEVYLWKNEDITPTNFPLMYSLINRALRFERTSSRSLKAPITALIRYEALYHHGGIYFDFKTEGVKKLDPFLKY